MSETSRELPEIKLALGSRPDVRIFRNHVGLAWQGDYPNQRRVTTGLFPGSGDLVGIRSYTVRPEDVGKKIGVFLSCEAKKGNAKLRPNQELWLQAIQLAGGISMVANSAESAVEQLESWRPKLARE